METKTMTTTTAAQLELRQPDPTYMAHRESFKQVARDRDLSPLGIAGFILLRVMFHRDDFNERGKSLTATEHALMKLQAAFSPVRNRTKLENGRRPYDTLERQLRRLEHSAPPELSDEQTTAFKEFAGEVLREHRSTRG